MYRPDGFINPYEQILKLDNSAAGMEPRFKARHQYASDCYNEGADAMLKALRENAFVSGASLRNTGCIGWQNISPNSKWYCIPGDKE
jgi:hypothetical protein